MIDEPNKHTAGSPGCFLDQEVAARFGIAGSFVAVWIVQHRHPALLCDGNTESSGSCGGGQAVFSGVFLLGLGLVLFVITSRPIPNIFRL